MQTKKISIITPSFNQAQYLEQTIFSILGQQIPNLEYIIIDGVSTDCSVDIIRKYEDRLAYWVSEKDAGQSNAINKGLAKAKGNILTWINSDDQLLPDTLLKVAALFEQNPDISVVHGNTQLYGAIKKPLIQGSPTIDLNERYLAGMAFPQPSSFFRREAFESVGLLNEALHFGMDYDFFVRMALQFNFLRVDDLFSKYLLHPQSKSVSSSSKFAHEWSWVFSKVLRSLPNTSDIISNMKDLDLYQDGTDFYKTKKTFNKTSLELAFYYHLYYLIVFLYQGLETKKVYEITRFIKKTNPSFFERENLANIYLKTKYLPKKVISIARKMKGS